MKAYIITIIGATLLSAMGGVLAPEKWRGYVQVVTGLVIISCIISPVADIVNSDILSGFDSVEASVADSENLQKDLVIEELKKSINEDISARLKKEFNLTVTADCEIRVNDEGEIEGVESVQIFGDNLTDRARDRICEVYGLEAREVHDG